jgi:hypothetical protein
MEDLFGKGALVFVEGALEQVLGTIFGKLCPKRILRDDPSTI